MKNKNSSEVISIYISNEDFKKLKVRAKELGFHIRQL